MKIGDIVSNNDIHDKYRCAPQGGMRFSNRTNTLVLIANYANNNVYHDRWINGILYYTGMGQKGDQDFNCRANKHLYKSKKTGIPIYLFECFHDKKYTFCGQVALAGEPYYEKQPDEDGKIRRICIFPLKPINSTDTQTVTELTKEQNEDFVITTEITEDNNKTVKEVKADTTGITYANLFGQYLKNATEITLQDQYIRQQFQLYNLESFIDVIIDNKQSDQVKLHLVTAYDSKETHQRQIEFFESLQKNYVRHGLVFDWEIHDSTQVRDVLHGRRIITDNGWTIILEKGLDIYQGAPYEEIRLHGQRVKKTANFTITYTRTEDISVIK